MPLVGCFWCVLFFKILVQINIYQTIWISSYMCRHPCNNLWGHQSSGVKSCSATVQTIFGNRNVPFSWFGAKKCLCVLNLGRSLTIWCFSPLPHIGLFLLRLITLTKNTKGTEAACPQTKKWSWVESCSNQMIWVSKVFTIIICCLVWNAIW